MQNKTVHGKTEAQKFYRHLVLYAQKHKNDPTLENDLKDEALKALSAAIKSVTSEADLKVLQGKNLAAIKALSNVMKSEKSNEWKSFDKAYEAFEKELDECAKEIIKVADERKIMTGRFERLVKGIRNITAVIGAVLVTSFIGTVTLMDPKKEAYKMLAEPSISALFVLTLLADAAAFIITATAVTEGNASNLQNNRELAIAVREYTVKKLGPIEDACDVLIAALGRAKEAQRIEK